MQNGFKYNVQDDYWNNDMFYDAVSSIEHIHVQISRAFIQLSHFRSDYRLPCTTAFDNQLPSLRHHMSSQRT
jgi:hypothetical protein